MGLAFKHVAVRLWGALLLGSLTALVMLPPLAGSMGPGLMILPAFLLIVIFYWLIGIVFGGMGRRRINRLIGEAAVWSRAGMAREARQALARAEATLYSYYFSPFSRKAPATQLLAQLARFQLSQPHPEPSSDALVGTYLREFPRDREAAVKWLEGVLAGRSITQQSYDIAVHIGATHVDDIPIQRMLAQFYATEGCCDFSALKSFRQLVESPEPLPEALLNDMIDLFFAHRRVDILALEVFLRGCQGGRTDPRLMEAIAACHHLVHPTRLTLPFLEKAEALLSGLSQAERRAMASRFLPEIDEREPLPSQSRKGGPTLSIGPVFRQAWAGIGTMGGKTVSAAVRIGRWARGGIWSRQAKMTVKWTVVGLFSIGVGWLGVSTALHFVEDIKPVEKVPVPVAAPISDPFTLQVAAYLKEEDARRSVDQLKKQGLDAYWTRTTGSTKTWYQVRISHFKTKDDARAMGESLKTRHLISDFYVANHKRSEVP